MLKLNYDEDVNEDVQCIRKTAGKLRIMARDKRNRLDDEERIDLSVAADMLIVFAKDIDKQSETCDNIGNLYKPHFNEESSEFQVGYNAAIRDAMDALFGKERYNG